MQKMKYRILALVLAMSMLLTGCANVDFDGYFDGLQSVVEGEASSRDGGFDGFFDTLQSSVGDGAVVRYESMEYTRPDMTQMEQTLQAACDAAAAGESVDTVMEAVYGFYEEYDWFYTCYNLADIRYSGDLTDIYWEKEYNYCMEKSAAVDAALEELYYALAKSPLRQELEKPKYFGAGFFDSYDGENLWDETFTAMLEQEAQLQNAYYELSTQSLDYELGSESYYDACADDMAQLLVDLIRMRQEIAAYWGYTDYVQFANDFYYYREFTPADMEYYLAEIQEELVDLYRQVDFGIWDVTWEYSSEEETLDFVRQAAKNMGGSIWEAFELLETAGLYDITYSENKYNSSFEVYLTSYLEPFVFMNPTLSRYDCLTFAHEFGHFCNDYVSYGSYAGIDVLEIFSQGMEYLSLFYGENGEDLVQAKLADSLCTYVEQAAYAAFEQRMYALTGDDLSVEGLYGLYEEVAQAYGFESMGYDKREFVTITHYYTNPMYIISYVVSNDAAMQLYQMELEETGTGLAWMENNLDTEVSYFLEFLQDSGLESPFAAGRIQQVRSIFEEAFA